MPAPQDMFGGFGPFIFVILMIGAVVSTAMTGKLFRLLRERHPAIYDSLGQPTLFWNNSLRTGFAASRFVLGGHFKETRDPEVIHLCRFIRAFSYSYWAFFVAVVVSGFVLYAR